MMATGAVLAPWRPGLEADRSFGGTNHLARREEPDGGYSIQAASFM